MSARPKRTETRQVTAAHALLSPLLCVVIAAVAGGFLGVPAIRAAAPAPSITSLWMAQSIASLQTDVQGSPVLSVGQKRALSRQLARESGQLTLVEALRRQIDAQNVLIRTLDVERAVARAGLDRLETGVRSDLATLTSALAFNTAPLSVTAQTVEVTNTVALSRAQLDLQLHAERLVIDVRTSAQILTLLTLNVRTRADIARLDAVVHATARELHLGLHAVLSDLRMVGHADPSAAEGAQSGLAAGLTRSLSLLNDGLLKALDDRQSLLRLDVTRLQTQLARSLSALSIEVDRTRQGVLASQIAAAPLTSRQRQTLVTGMTSASVDLHAAATLGAALEDRLATLSALDDAQARIDREMQKAQSDLDGLLAQSDAALQGRLRSDVTVTISDTEQTIHVHLDSIQVGALVRDLDFNVKLGLSVLQIAALHAEVTPDTHTLSGTTSTRIEGVDLLLQAHLHGLQAHILTDVDAVQAEQTHLSQAAHARIAALRATLSNVLAPLIRRYAADSARLQASLDGALTRVTTHLTSTRASVSAMAHVEALDGRVTGTSVVALRGAPTSASAVVDWVAPGSVLPLIGYVWGWRVCGDSTGHCDARWYVVRNLGGRHGDLYVPAADVVARPT